MKLYEIGVVIVLTIAVLWCGSAIAWPDEVETCHYIWHDHYKVNYRIRHKHQVCNGLANHYDEDPVMTQYRIAPEIGVTYVIEGEEDTATTKN